MSESTAWGELRKLPRSIWWLAGATLINRMGSMVFPFLVLYFHRRLGFGLEQATGIAAFYGLGSALAAPLGGYLADRFDCIRVLSLALGVSGSILVLFPFLRGGLLLSGMTLLLALFADLARPSTMTSLARLGGPQQSREAFSLNYLAINLGMCVGPTLGGFLAVLDYSYLFWVDGVSSLLACALLMSTGIRCPVFRRSEHSVVDWRLGRPAFQLFGLMVLALWAFSTYFAATPVYVVEVLHLPESRCGLIWLVNTVVIVCTTVHFNHWTRNRPIRQQLTFAALCLAGCYAALSVWPGTGGLLISILLLTAGEMMLFLNSTAYLQSVVPEEKLGRAMGLNAVCISTAIAFSTPTVGYFFSRRTPADLWLVAAAACLVAALGFARLPTKD